MSKRVWFSLAVVVVLVGVSTGVSMGAFSAPGAGPGPLGTTWSKVRSVTSDGVRQTLLSITNFAKITDSDLSSETHTLIVENTNPWDYVEWALWHEGTVTQGELSPGTLTKVTFPHYKDFIVQISRPIWSANTQGAVLCRENDNILGCVAVSGGVRSIPCNDVDDTLIEIPNFGRVTDRSHTPCADPDKVRIKSLGPYVEGALWWQGNYVPCDAPAGGTMDCSYPDWYPFFVQISRPASGYSAWLFCRANDGYINCMQFPGGPTVYLGDYVPQLLTNVANFAKVGDRGVPDSSHSAHYYRVTSNGPIVEYSTWQNTAYVNGETPAWGQSDVSMPHWKLFIISAWRAQQGAFAQAWLLCKENDYFLTCYVMA